MKFKQNEEYLYGDYLIGSYDFIKGLVRQHEIIYFYLKKLSNAVIQPPLMSFPPIIIHKEPKVNYISLLKKYLLFYQEGGIIYRFARPDQAEKERFLKQTKGRIEGLLRYTESGDCYYPLYIHILRINNVYSLKSWFEDKEYNKNDMMLPNFTYYPPKEKKNTKKNICDKLCFCCHHKSSQSEQEEAEEKANKKEKKMRMKTMSSMSKKNEFNFELQEKLNRLKISTEKSSFFNFSINSLTLYNKLFGDKVADIIDYLSNSNESSSKNITESNNNYHKKYLGTFDKDNQHYIKAIKLNQCTNDKYIPFNLEHFNLPFIPVFVRLKISLLYGSYSFLTCKTKPSLLSNDVLLNDKILFDQKCLISHLPFETRIAITLEGYDRAMKKSIVLGSCQIPLYLSTGEMQSGIIVVNLWPNITPLPRINNCSSFNLLKNTKKHVMSELARGTYPDAMKDYIDDIHEKMEEGFQDTIKLYNQDKEEEAKKENIEELLKKYVVNERKGKRNESANVNENGNYVGSVSSSVKRTKTKRRDSFFHGNGFLNKLISRLNKEEKQSEQKETNDNNINNNDNNNHNNEEESNSSDTCNIETIENIDSIDKENKIEPFCSIQLQFPKFTAPLIYSQNVSQSYRNFLEVKYKNSYSYVSDDFIEIRKLYGNSQKDIGNIVTHFEESDLITEESTLQLNNSFYLNSSDSNKDSYPRDIWEYIQKTLPLMINILKKDPLEALDEQEIVAILICRDYISTIPSALELFLRAIDWLDPLQVSLAHLYIKKWAKLEVEDAISLLDARFPDTEIREFAVSMLRDLPDDLINMYMLQLCQCLLYETFLLNPLADFLIERSLSNPKLIGASFFWNSRVNMNNPLFAERLSAYLIQIFMISGDTFLKDIFNGIYLNSYLQLMTHYVKITNLKKKEKPEKCVSTCLKFFEEKLHLKNFTFPIDPTYFGVSFTKDRRFKVFGSKMLPILLYFNSREGDSKNVIFKIGDDLRQDVLTLQIFKIMDKLWLDNNLDLKLLPYKVCPTGLKAGFIECLAGIELDKLQMKQGIGGAFNKELIVNFLREQNMNQELEIKFDNFIKSLAGYCVATCVIGIGDRHPGNIMLKDNGIFFHIDFGHILGNFKYKFYIKRERSLFLLTPEMAHVFMIQGKEEYFKTCCVKAFNILRHNAQRLISMFIIMSTAGMPELCGMNDVKYVKKMLVLDKMSDEDAGNYFIAKMKESRNDRFRLLDNMIHNLKH